VEEVKVKDRSELDNFVGERRERKRRRMGRMKGGR
jgi:hypothetical protein